ncbi:hypothetical protein [Sphingobium boeckii]|uniref:MraZ protein n=1 Tax=Sphingobium boeckii TaxID=1082345 RepID=A0A7W9AII9_9SPHN|nr:hypothetical protein [Sphingobium boeckii]MBB5686086.1 MraZ protein [Sphingobium boeckii]
MSVIDAKGRVSIPPELRSLILENGANEPRIALNFHNSEQYLVAFEKAYIPELQAKSDRDYAEREDPSLTRDYFDDQNFGTLETQPFDASGRFIMSPVMRRLGQFEDLAFFFGSGAVIRIWNPWLARESALVPRGPKVILETLLEQKGLL